MKCDYLTPPLPLPPLILHLMHCDHSSHSSLLSILYFSCSSRLLNPYITSYLIPPTHIHINCRWRCVRHPVQKLLPHSLHLDFQHRLPFLPTSSYPSHCGTQIPRGLLGDIRSPGGRINGTGWSDDCEAVRELYNQTGDTPLGILSQRGHRPGRGDRIVSQKTGQEVVKKRGQFLLTA